MPELEALLRAILEPDEDARPGCQPCREVLYAYVEAELDGKDAPALFPATRAHLQACPDCREEYEDLKALFSGERAGRFAEAPGEPTFDLSFLQRAVAPQMPSGPAPRKGRRRLGKRAAAHQAMEEPLWRRDEQGAIWLQLARHLGAGAHPPLTWATKAGEAEPATRPEIVARLSVGAEETGTADIEVTVYRDERDPGLCTVAIRVEVPARWPELAGTRVTMQSGAETVSALADQAGEVRFAGLPIARLGELAFCIAP